MSSFSEVFFSVPHLVSFMDMIKSTLLKSQLEVAIQELTNHVVLNKDVAGVRTEGFVWMKNVLHAQQQHGMCAQISKNLIGTSNIVVLVVFNAWNRGLATLNAHFVVFKTQNMVASSSLHIVK